MECNSYWDRRSISRRRMLGATAAGSAGLVAVATVGCGDDDDDASGDAPTNTTAPDPTATPLATGPQSGGTVKVGVVVDFATLDPGISTSGVTSTITQQAYDNLLMVQPDLSMKPELATSWESNDDLTSYIFNLRKGVKFHHGKDFSAEDVVFTFERLLDPEFGSPILAQLGEGTTVVATDDYTVRFDLLSSNGYFPSYMQQDELRILAADQDLDKLAGTAIGTGPFIMEENLPGERITLVRNPNYWEEGKPYLDEMHIMNIPEAAGRDAAIVAGDIDLIHRGLSPLSVPALEADPGVTVKRITGWGWIGLIMDNARPPFDNKTLRKAFQAAMDREAVNQAALLGLGGPAFDHPIAPSNPVFASQYAPPDYDIALAKSLLEQAGYPDGIDVDLHTSDISAGVIDLAVAYKESAAPADIRVNVVVDPSTGFWDTVWQKETFTIDTWRGADPDQALSEQFHSGSPYNAHHYINPVTEALIDKAKGQDLEGQKESYAEVQRILIDDVPAIVACFRPEMLAMRNEVQGIEPHLMSWPLFQDGWLDLNA